MRWRDSKPWEAKNIEEEIGKLKKNTLGKMKEVMTPSDEITLEPNAVNETSNAINETDEVEHAVLILPTVFPPMQHSRRVTRSVATGDASTK